MFWRIAQFKEAWVALCKGAEGVLFIQHVPGMSLGSVGMKTRFSSLPVYSSPGFMAWVVNTAP